MQAKPALNQRPTQAAAIAFCLAGSGWALTTHCQILCAEASLFTSWEQSVRSSVAKM